MDTGIAWPSGRPWQARVAYRGQDVTMEAMALGLGLACMIVVLLLQTLSRAARAADAVMPSRERR